jgi:two-component system response regulator MprA
MDVILWIKQAPAFRPGDEETMNNTILLIDDDEVETDLMRRLLSRHGFEVIVSNSSLEGIRLVIECDPGMVILDLTMPEMAGWEVCKEIRRFSDVHILIFSAVSEPNLVAKALFAGADHFLPKPTPITALVEYIDGVINLTSGQSLTMSESSMLQNVWSNVCHDTDEM